MEQHAGMVRISSRLYRCDRHGAIEEEITSAVLAATVDLDVDRIVSPFLLRGELRIAGAVTVYADHIQPWLRLEYPSGLVVDEPVGLYGTAPPNRERSYRVTRERLTGMDHTWRLSTSYFAGPYTIPGDADPVEAVKDVCRSEGFTDADLAGLVATTKRTVAAQTWGLDQPITKLEIVNTVLGAIGSVRLHTGRAGGLAAFPLPDLETALVAKTYTTEGDEITEAVTEEPDASRVCNVVRVVNDRDGASPIVAIAENHNPASPVSIENIGRILFRDERDSGIPDQQTADAIALRLLQEGATYDNRATLVTAPDPERDPHDIYEFALDQRDASLVLAGRWRCTGWTLGFGTAELAMRHQIGKVVPV